MVRIIAYVLLLSGVAAVCGGLYVGLARRENPGPFFLLGMTMLALGGGCWRAIKARRKTVDSA